MFLGWIYRYIIAAAFALLMLGYNIYCFLGLFKLGREASKKEIESTEDIKSKYNLYIWFIKKTLSKNKKPKEIKVKIRVKIAKRINIGVIVASLGVVVINVALIAAIYMLNMQATNIANILTTLFGDKDCVCYAKCTGNGEDDTKTAYELLFGPDEYKKLYESIAITPTEKQPFLDMHETNPNGKTEGEWLITHIDDNAVQCYKAIVGDNNKFRSGDHKDRSQMTNGELRDDLIALLSDYKVDGRNPNCQCCTSVTDLQLGRKCLGEAHYIEGWTWEAIWNSDNTDDGGEGGGGIGGGGNTSAQNSIYGLQLDDGWFYWYHQTTTCNCAHNVDHPTYGRYGTTLLYEPNRKMIDNLAGNRGCSTYSTAMAVSNALGIEVTPYTLLVDIFGGTFTQKSDGMWVYSGGTSYIDLSNIPPNMNMSATAELLQQYYYDKGLRAEVINLSQSTVDEYLAKGAYIVTSWRHGMAWYHPNDNGDGTHFMVIRKKGSDGNYYCLDSVPNDNNAVNRMTTPSSWSNMSSKFRHGIGVAYYNINPQNSGGEDGGDIGLVKGLAQDPMSFYNKCNISKGSPTVDLGDGLYLYNGLPWDNNGAYILDNGKVNQYISSFLGMSVKYSIHSDKYCSATPITGAEGVISADVAGLPINSFCTINDAGGVEGWSSSTRPKKFCAILEDNAGNTFYLPLTCSGDAKGHIWPGGVCQTFLSIANQSVGNWNFNSDNGTIKGDIIGKPISSLDEIKSGYSSVRYQGSLISPQINLEMNANIKSRLDGVYKMKGYISWK